MTKPGWMLKADPKLGAKVKAKQRLEKKRQDSYGDPSKGISVRKEETDNIEQIDELSDKLLKNYTKKVKDEHDAIVDAEMQMPYDRLNPLKSSRYKGYTRASSILHNRRLLKNHN